MTKKIVIIVFLLVNITNAQVSYCPNSDFELGGFSGWNGQIGKCCPIGTSPSGIIIGRHTIMSGTATDPDTCNQVTVVAPAGLYSTRLGNNNNNNLSCTLNIKHKL